MGTLGTRGVSILASSWNFRAPRKRLNKANTKRRNSARRYEVSDEVLQLLKNSVMCVPVVKTAGITMPWPWSGYFISMVMFTVPWSWYISSRKMLVHTCVSRPLFVIYAHLDLVGSDRVSVNERCDSAQLIEL